MYLGIQKSMADPNFSWIYLVIFLAIPLARIVPRILAKRRNENNVPNTIQEKPFQLGIDEMPQKPQMGSSKHQTKNMLVLGALNRGAKTFESIQKNTGFDNKELDAILEDLENNGMLKVKQKQGLFGPKTELYSTDRGFKEYYS